MLNHLAPLPVLAIALEACSNQPELLNSERIEKAFGSCGIEILESNDVFRRTSLYSNEAGERVCRTYAVAQFLEQAAGHTDEGHAEVVSGGSIGATFKAHGWQIYKQTLHVGKLTIASPAAGIAQLMRLHSPQHLAMHVYRLLLEKDDQSVEYARIIEVHHPDYLDEAALRELFDVSESTFLSQDQLSALVSLVTASQNN
jgi:hypothetical protein